MAGRWTGAASDALLPVLTGPARPATVVGAGPVAVYLRAEPSRAGDDAALVALVTRQAVRVPCAVVVADAEPLPFTLAPGRRLQVGDGSITWDAGVLTVVRWWPAATVTGTPGRTDLRRDPTAPRDGLPRRLAALRLAVGPHVLPEGVPTALERAAEATDRRDAATAAAALRPVLGLGSGLTPSADDAVAGLLLAARSWSGAGLSATVAELGARLAAGLAARTTAVSAGLLRHAAEGRGAPEVVRAVEHLTGRSPADEAQVLRELVSLGHSSGRDTAAGILTYLYRQLTVTNDPTSHLDPTDPTRPDHPPLVRESA
ncbi:MAG TPA: DUF2877 domain-containing protein [Actinomycetales bacterium]|nr:DUF2877 domain-containing protein [Actinomycetales bacterium]